MSPQRFLQTNRQLAELVNEPLLAGWRGLKAHIQTREPKAMETGEQLHDLLRDPVDGIRITQERAIEAGRCGVNHKSRTTRNKVNKRINSSRNPSRSPDTAGRLIEEGLR